MSNTIAAQSACPVINDHPAPDDPQRHAQSGRLARRRLRTALQRNEIYLKYQPLHLAMDDALVGVEALSRWAPDGGSEITAADFVPAMHRLGLGQDLFRHVLTRALKDLSPALHVRRQLYVCVNAEYSDLGQDFVVRFIIEALSAFDILPSQLRIEITEHEDLSSLSARWNIEALRLKGINFIIDDFGAGCSNFSHITHELFNGVKLDRMLLHEVSEAKSLHPILTSIYQLCLDLKLDFIAEGVETAQHALLLQRLTPLAIGQGWWYGFPLPATDIIRHMLELAAEAK